MPNLQLDGVSFHYRSGPRVISSMTATFWEGSTTAITGPSGCGKSTLLYLLGLMLRPSQGSILLGSDVVSLRSDALRSKIRGESLGFVFQDTALDPTRSILDNVLEPTEYHPFHTRSGRKAHALELLDRFAVSLPPERRPGEISGGQAQRVGLCRALINGPAVLLADEPTGNLDSESARLVFNALTSAAHDDGSVVVIVTHSPDLASRCDVQLSLQSRPMV